jgi:repressor LexA
MEHLTPAQQKTLDFIREEAMAGRPTPTHREIAARFGYKSHRAAACHLEALKRKGYLASEKGKARSLSFNSAPLVCTIPIFGSIPAGHAESREQDSDEFVAVDLSSLGLKWNKNLFGLRVTGDSMIQKHICDGDIAILEHGVSPKSDQVVAALVDSKTTLKTFMLRKGKPYLKAENPRYKAIVPTEELQVQGVLRGVIRRAK